MSRWAFPGTKFSDLVDLHYSFLLSTGILIEMDLNGVLDIIEKDERDQDWVRLRLRQKGGYT